MEDSDSETEYNKSDDSQEASEPEHTPDAVTSDDSVAQGRGHSKALSQKLLKEVMFPIDITLPMFNENSISVRFGLVTVRRRL